MVGRRGVASGDGVDFYFPFYLFFRLLAGKLFVLEGRADPILEGGAGVAALVLSQRVHYAAILIGAIPTRVSDVLRQRKHSRECFQRCEACCV